MASRRQLWWTFGQVIVCVSVCVTQVATAEKAHLWLDQSSRPTPRVWSAIDMLAHANDDGLDPQRYDAGPLALEALRLQSARQVNESEARRFDSEFSAASVLFLHHLAMGRVAPGAVGFDLDAPPEWQDLGRLMSSAATEDRLSDLVKRLRSRNVQYEELREALGQYRGLVGDPAFRHPLEIEMPVHPGAALPEAAALGARLIALGDLGEDADLDATRYSGALVEAVKRFQHRHGLEPDGVLGRDTVTALNVPIATRVRQLQLALERWRWLPRLDGRVVLVNLAAAELWAMDSHSDAPPLAMPVIVGHARRNATPVFQTTLQSIQIAPYWYVPLSIAREELLPAIARDSGVLDRLHLEVISGFDDDAAVLPATAANLELVRDGILRLRQQPGAGNALGPVAFSIPNEHGIVMHGTPDLRLFERTHRDVSHGCVRVADPIGLAVWALAGEGGWSREQIAGQSQAVWPTRVPVRGQISVLVFYTTAGVDPVSGDVWFRRDLYGLDSVLERALAEEAGDIDASSCELIHDHAGKGATTSAPARQSR